MRGPVGALSVPRLPIPSTKYKYQPSKHQLKSFLAHQYHHAVETGHSLGQDPYCERNLAIPQHREAHIPLWDSAEQSNGQGYKINIYICTRPGGCSKTSLKRTSPEGAKALNKVKRGRLGREM